MPPAPVSKIHACWSFATLAGVICLSGENRVPPASRSWEGQSPSVAAAVSAPPSASGTRSSHEDTKTRRTLRTKRLRTTRLRVFVTSWRIDMCRLLEPELQRKLHDSRVARGEDLSERPA